MSAVQAPIHGEEPPMYLQRPSSARSQDVTHVLAHTFRHLFTRDSVAPDTVQNLSQSRGGDDPYHEKYVEQLQKVQEERERRLAEAAMLERHIMQAQARAMSADEKALQRVSSATQQFPDLGLPPAKSHFQSCIDSELMKKHNLITPEDFLLKISPIVPGPRSPAVPDYARDTVSSSKKQGDDCGSLLQTPLLPVRGGLSDHVESSWDDRSSIHFPDLPGRSRVPRGGVWQDEPDAEQREANRRELANLQARVDFLKNPRHVAPSADGVARSLVKPYKRQPTEIGIKSKPQKAGHKEPVVVFVPSPEVVMFKQYCVGQVYETTLELKNVTAALRPVRVIPPKSSFFSVGLGQFPGEHGLVAPGMSCHYTVRFSPDSLGDFYDELLVQSQASTSVVVQLVGHRASPVLTLPPVLDIGHCLVGGCRVAEITVGNVGGPGRFCLMPRSVWPATNFKKVVNAGCAMAPPFEIRPPVLELGQGESMVVEVVFSPSAVERYTETFTAVCDNCQVQHFDVVGEGQIAIVEITEMEDGLSEAIPGEVCDDTASHLVRFGPLNPYTYVQRTFTVKNTANVEIPFNWVVVRPSLKPLQPPPVEGVPDTEIFDEGETVCERIQDAETAFGVEPQSGVLPPGGVSQFVATFAPPEVGDFHSVLHMVLRNIPRPVVSPGDLQERPGSQTSDGVPEIRLPSSVAIEDMTALEVEAKGVCEPFNVILQPYAIYMPGQVLVTSSTKKMFRMVNLSVSSIMFQWENFSADYILQVEPPFGEIGPEEEMDLELTVSSSVPGKIIHTLMCHVRNLAQPIALHVEAEIKGPEIVIENPDINFGLVRLGDTVVRTIVLHNSSQVVAKWNLEESQEHKETEDQTNPFAFTPSSGELSPLGTCEVDVQFRPSKCQSLHTIFELAVQDGNCSTISVLSEVQDPSVCLLSCDLVMAGTYVEVAVCHQVSLLNQTLLPTTFEWGEVEGSQAKMCSVKVEPRIGSIQPRETLPVNLHFTAHRMGEMSDLKVACRVAGMQHPLYLSLYSQVLGLDVSYTTQGSEQTSRDDGKSSELLLDFGSVNIGANPKQLLHIKNNSGITAPFNITVEHFYAKPPTPPDRRPAATLPNKSQRRSLLAKTAHLSDPTSKTPAQVHAERKAQAKLCRVMLQEGRGAAFTVTPSSGMLQPFTEQVIEVTGYSDMWGCYQDRLVCRVERLEVVNIPLRMEVCGCPLQFQMVAAQPSQQPVLRFGTHVSGVGPLSRQMRINNNSPFDIRLDWQIFNQISNDTQIVDMVVTYGQAFPVYDSEGREVTPSWQEEVSTDDQPADLTLGSPETTGITTTSRSDSEYDAGVTVALKQKRPKILTVTMREHHGVEARLPYQFNPAQMVVAGRSNTCINVTFYPLSEPQDTAGRDCPAYALGYMSLEQQVSYDKNWVKREHGYEVQPLRLNMTGHVKPALLSIECGDDEGMRYRAAASDLVQNGQLVGEHIRFSHTKLSNSTETPLVFRLLSSEPFFLVELDPNSRLPVAQLLQTDPWELKPGQNMMVQVGFCNSLELLDYLATLDGDSPQPQNGVELERTGQERRLHFKQDLIIEFNNKSVQRLPLYATLAVPSLVLSKDSIDFGMCLVGQQREHQLMLSNPTGSNSHWKATQERRCENCVEGTFVVTPDSGKLEAYITHVSNSKVLLQIYFTAKHAETYESVYSFHGMLGETPALLTIKGEGSYDGRHEAQVNI